MVNKLKSNPHSHAVYILVVQTGNSPGKSNIMDAKQWHPLALRFSVILSCAHWHTRPFASFAPVYRHTCLFRWQVIVGRYRLEVSCSVGVLAVALAQEVSGYVAQQVIYLVQWNHLDSFPGLVPAGDSKQRLFKQGAYCYVVSFFWGSHSLCRTKLLPFYQKLKTMNTVFLLRLLGVLCPAVLWC